ncbi:MAG: hypothetical protein O7A63_11035 [Acidobacteria bacterium]|nr:hypothetical protein [Acidobacteriota bacterium]
MTKTTPIAIAVDRTEKRIASAIVAMLGNRPDMFKPKRVAIATRDAALLDMIHVRHRGQSTGFGIRSMPHLQAGGA